MQLAAGMQAAGLGTGLANLNFPLNLPFGFPATGGYSTNSSGMLPQAANQPNSEQFTGTNNQSRFSGPPGRGGLPRRDNRGGRPNRWDDRGNYDERRRDEFRRDADRNRNNEQRGRGGFGPRDRGGRDGEFIRRERNRAGKLKNILNFAFLLLNSDFF